MYILCLLLLSQCVFVIGDNLSFDVTIAQGIVRGYKHATRELYEFHGIPYATAPTGRQKFKEAYPAPHWPSIFYANNSVIMCPQPAFYENEDCLVVNVFVPAATTVGQNLKSVFVIIHGGAFIAGFGNALLPYHLVEKDVVVVTFNYRLGVHGFVCLNTENIPGNAGLRDQLAALRWVKQNIRAFGGDSDDITVGGYSAGAASLEILALSPVANGLFHKIILESGSGIGSWAVNPLALELAKSVAVSNGASDVNDISNLEDFYLSLSYQELVTMVPGTELLFTPCIENDDGDREVIVRDLPYKYLLSGNYNKLPLLTGYTDAEGLIFYENREQNMALMNEDFKNVLPPHFASYAAVDEEEGADLIKPFYFGVDIINYDSIKNLTDYYTDGEFSFWVVESAKQNALNAAPVYLYEYTYVTSADEVTGPGLGAAHCAQTELILISFRVPENYTELDLIVQNRLVTMWTNFIKYGKPVLPGSSHVWEPLDPEKMNYMVIGFELENKMFPSPDRLQLWDKIWFGRSDTDAVNSLHSNLLILFLFVISVVL